MNKKIILIIIVLILGISASIYFFTKSDSDIEVTEKLDIEDYPSNILCIYEEDEVSEDEYPYITNVYLSYNKGGKVTEVIYQTLFQVDMGASYVKLLNDFYSLYNGIEGINTNVYSKDNYVVSTIKYNFSNIDFNSIDKDLGDILESDAFILNVDRNTHFEDFIEDYLKDYKCEVR